MSLQKEHLAARFAERDLNLRDSRNGRWIDQKVTPDVLTFIADAVVNLPSDKLAKEFTKNDVWRSQYFETNITVLFGKPRPVGATSHREYDKLCGQPLKALANAGVLSEDKRGNSNVYRVVDEDLLTFISLNTHRAFTFLTTYIESVLEQSGFMHHVLAYVGGAHTRESMAELKSKFEAFTRANTGIQRAFEPRRIFPKVINPIAVDRGIPGVARGVVTKSPYVFSDLMYNVTNWRDKNKPKGIPRDGFATSSPVEKYASYEVAKAMEAVRRRHSPESEVKDKYSTGEATQVHHIFPQSGYPDLAATPENLVLLTPQQHYTCAHPRNNTSLVDRNYQVDCLVAKVRALDEQLDSDPFYSRESMRKVICAGFAAPEVLTCEWDDIVPMLQKYRSV